MIAGIHGILSTRYYRKAPDLAAATRAIGADWARWLHPGLAAVVPDASVPLTLPMAYYSDCLKPSAPTGADDPRYLDPVCADLFLTLVAEIRLVTTGEPAGSALSRAGRPIRQAAQWLLSAYGDAALRLVTLLVREIRVYFAEEYADRRAQAQERLADLIRAHRPRVLIAHSLGGVVAYETLWADPSLEIELLLTLGSPLGAPAVVFDRLVPAPGGRGARPPGVGRWVNVADTGDPVAAPARRLVGLFDGVDEDHETSAHSLDVLTARNYLGCKTVAQEIAPYTE